jgi:hypothetical protein
VRTIYCVAHDGVVGVIESPEKIDPARPLGPQLRVKIGFQSGAPPLDAEDFKARVRLVILELLNHLHDELGVDG